MRFYIYLITRDDGQLYVGTTNSKNIKSRMYGHKRSDKFIDHEFSYKILVESEDDKIHDLEEFYIKKYNSFYDGLNESIDGKGNHLASNFTTKGYKFSDASRKKMSETRKRLIKEGKVKLPIFIWTKKRRKEISQKRKGKINHIKFSDSLLRDIRKLYLSKPNLKYNFICGNGKLLTYERAFAKKYSEKFNMTSNFLYKFLIKKTRTNV